MASFDDVLKMALDLGYTPRNIDRDEQLFELFDDEEDINVVIDCEGELLVLEQAVMPVTPRTSFQTLLRLNQELVHGAYALGDNEKLVVWRDTLQLKTLDSEELAGSINAVSLAMAQHRSVLYGMR